MEKGTRVKHKEQKYIGTIHQEDGPNHVLVMPEDPYILSLYPYGIRAHKDKLIEYPKENK